MCRGSLALRQWLLCNVTGRIVDEFLGVPFASPPERFGRPQPPQPWEGVLDATVYSPHCIHFVAAFYPAIGYSNETSEDCLYLNIYVPDGIENIR
jgi:para-nitrobenzyl esterase